MSDQPYRVLLVDDEVQTVELIGEVLQRQGFVVSLAQTSRAAQTLLRKETFDAVVTDVVFDGREEGAEVLAATRKLQPSAVVILMTGYPVIEGAVSAIKLGALDYLQKPVDPVVLAAMVHRALRERAMDSENLGFDELVDILSGMVAHTIERIDPYTAGHGARTRRYCRLVAQHLGVDVPTTEKLELAAIAHDYGKIYLDDLGFLTKNGPLTDSEYTEVKRHPALGAKKLGSHGRLREVCQWIAQHHEKWDGTGYPHGLAGEDISLPGRILGVVEVFDSLATKRSYKKAWPLEQVLEFFGEQREKAFDPAVLDPFVSLLEEHGVEWLQQPARDRAAHAAAKAAPVN